MYNIFDVFKDIMSFKLKFASRKDARLRASICKECEVRTKYNTCSICGCIIPLKVRLKKSSCPMEKW